MVVKMLASVLRFMNPSISFSVTQASGTDQYCLKPLSSPCMQCHPWIHCSKELILDAIYLLRPQRHYNVLLYFKEGLKIHPSF